MIGISAPYNFPCILIGGPKHGKIDRIAGIFKDEPVEEKLYPSDKKDTIICYRPLMIKNKYAKLTTGHFVLYYDEKYK